MHPNAPQHVFAHFLSLQLMSSTSDPATLHPGVAWSAEGAVQVEGIKLREWNDAMACGALATRHQRDTLYPSCRELQFRA